MISSACKVSFLCLGDKVLLSEGNTTTNDSHIFDDVLKVKSLTITSINSETLIEKNFRMQFFVFYCNFSFRFCIFNISV